MQTYSREQLTRTYNKEQRQGFVAQDIVIRRVEDSGIREDAKTLAFKVNSIEEHLTFMGVHPDDYSKVYNLACQLHRKNGQSPFSIDFIIDAVNFLRKSEVKRNLTNSTKKCYTCSYCKDTKLKLNGLLPETEEIEGKKVYKPCEHCTKNSGNLLT